MMPYCSDRLRAIQQMLKDRYGQKIDVDGWMGPATEAAIFDVLDTPLDTAIADAENEGMVARAGMPTSIVQNVPHISQGDPSIADMVLSPGTDTCQQSGCLTVALWACINNLGIQIGITDFIDNLIGRGCYNARSRLDQFKAVDLWGLGYKKGIGRIEGENYLRLGMPVILRIPRPHFYIGLGYDAEPTMAAMPSTIPDAVPRTFTTTPHGWMPTRSTDTMSWSGRHNQGGNTMTKLIFPGENAGISEVLVTDSPAQRSNMCHEYLVRHVDPEGGVLCAVSFQNGPVKEPGSKFGVQNEDLLKIVLHRLQGAQAGEFACRENRESGRGCRAGPLMYLNMRTADRQQRAVEGLNKQ